MRFALGDVVTWESQANGQSRVKIGTVVEVIPAGRWPTHYRIGDGMERDHESYVVRAVAQGRAVPKRVTYWPRVSALRAVAGAADESAPNDATKGGSRG